MENIGKSKQGDDGLGEREEGEVVKVLRKELDRAKVAVRELLDTVKEQEQVIEELRQGE